MSKIKIALIITYDGKEFEGWQDNLANRSIEGSLKKALFALFQRPFNLDAASRTDGGVHALTQVVVTELDETKIPLTRLCKALNAHLPLSIRVKEILEVPHAFHPSLSIGLKTYLYQMDPSPYLLPLRQNTHWHYPFKLDVKLMQRAAAELLGQHDFSSFCTDHKKNLKSGLCHLQELQITEQANGCITFKLSADRFLYKMCRTLVGTLSYLGSNRWASQKTRSFFSALSRKDLGPTAPPQGLFLASLYYPEYDFINKLTTSRTVYGTK